MNGVRYRARFVNKSSSKSVNPPGLIGRSSASPDQLFRTRSRSPIHHPQTRRHHLGECPGAMADGVLHARVHFTECLVATLGNGHRIITETVVAAWCPDHAAVDPADIRFRMLIRPGEA